MGRVPINHRILSCNCRETEVSGDPAINLSDDTVFQFLSEEFEGTLSPARIFNENDEDHEKENEIKDENRSTEDCFWEEQHQLLQTIIRRTTALESRIRSITKEAVKELQSSGEFCNCSRQSNAACRKCQMEAVCRRLQNAGFDTAICKSKWRSSPAIPSGEHTFLDVIDNSSNSRKEVRVIIELNFRGEFEMARAHEEYNRLVNRLPEVFVGKTERLVELLKILCAAAKKCMEEKKMHLGPWRKHRYMQAKWLRNCDRIAPPRPLSAVAGEGGRPVRPTMSMLTVDLMEVQRTVVVVVV